MTAEKIEKNLESFIHYFRNNKLKLTGKKQLQYICQENSPG